MKLLFTLFSLMAVSTAWSQRCATEDYIQQTTFARGGGISGPGITKNGRDTIANETIVIPVVVHVLYNNNVQNISDKQILSQIEALNRDFSRTNADAVKTPEPFKKVAADTKISFVLANVDMQGRPTSGIVRTFTKEKQFLANDDVKFSSKGGSDAWDASKYLNIWVCNLFGRTLGYSVLPGSPAERDGVVIKYTAFGTEGTVSAPYHMGRTATHEIGHWLGLLHIWGNGNCGDDGIADTPPQQSANNYCTSFPKLSPCSIDSYGDMFMNFMDLTEDACMNLFTVGQKNKMRGLLANGNARNSLLLSNGYDPLMEAAPLPPVEKEPEEVEVLLYPNPFTNEIRVKTRAAAGLNTITIYNVTGKLFIHETLKNSGSTLNVSHLPTGVYMVKIKTGESEKTFKLIK